MKANDFMKIITAVVKMKTPKEGSWSQLWAATGSRVVSGEYCVPIGVIGKRTESPKI
jgi:hypothetical protein